MRRSTFDLTRGQVSFVKKNWNKLSNGAMSRKLGINFSTFSSKLHNLGLFRMHLEYWTVEQVEFLKKNYKKIGDKELAILFNGLWEKEKRWTFKHIEKKRMYLKLKRTTKQLALIKIRNRTRGCWLGHSAWETRGISPDGTIRIWKHSWQNRYGKTGKSFKAIKVNGKFVHYARWLYEKAFGPMGRGFVIGFKDHNNLNVVLENLESITRAEHARRNASNAKYPEDLRSLEKILKELNNTISLKL